MLAHLEVGQRDLQKDLWAQPHWSWGVCWICTNPCVLPAPPGSPGLQGELEQILAEPRHIPSVHVAAVVIPSQQLLHIPDPGNEGWGLAGALH